MHARFAKITACVLSGLTLIGVAAATNVACYGMASSTEHMPLPIAGATCYTLCSPWNNCNSNRTYAGTAMTATKNTFCGQQRTVIVDEHGVARCTGSVTQSGYITVPVPECQPKDDLCPSSGGGGTGEEQPNPCNGC